MFDEYIAVIRAFLGLWFLTIIDLLNKSSRAAHRELHLHLSSFSFTRDVFNLSICSTSSINWFRTCVNHMGWIATFEKSHDHKRVEWSPRMFSTWTAPNNWSSSITNPLFRFRYLHCPSNRIPGISALAIYLFLNPELALFRITATLSPCSRRKAASRSL